LLLAELNTEMLYDSQPDSLLANKDNLKNKKWKPEVVVTFNL
jgi:hypothetical protein